MFPCRLQALGWGVVVDVGPGRDRHLTGWLRAIGDSRLSQNSQHYHCYHLDIGTWESRLDASGYAPRCFSSDLWVDSIASAKIALIPYMHIHFLPLQAMGTKLNTIFTESAEKILTKIKVGFCTSPSPSSPPLRSPLTRILPHLPNQEDTPEKDFLETEVVSVRDLHILQDRVVWNT